MVVVKLIVIVLVLVSSAVGSDASVIQRLIVRLEDPPSHPSSDNCTLFKQIEVRFNFVDIFRNSGCLFVDDRNIQKVSSARRFVWASALMRRFAYSCPLQQPYPIPLNRRESPSTSKSFNSVDCIPREKKR